jgi:hypothetical protein
LQLPEFIDTEVGPSVIGLFPTEIQNEISEALNSLNQFQRIIILRIVRPDKTVFCMQKFI